MIFGPSLLKEVDSPAISKMGPTFAKVAEGGPKGAGSPAPQDLAPKGQSVEPIYV